MRRQYHRRLNLLDPRRTLGQTVQPVGVDYQSQPFLPNQRINHRLHTPLRPDSGPKRHHIIIFNQPQHRPDCLTRHTPPAVRGQTCRRIARLHRRDNTQHTFRHRHTNKPRAAAKSRPARNRRRTAHTRTAAHNTNLPETALMSVLFPRRQFWFFTYRLHNATRLFEGFSG